MEEESSDDQGREYRQQDLLCEVDGEQVHDRVRRKRSYRRQYKEDQWSFLRIFQETDGERIQEDRRHLPGLEHGAGWKRYDLQEQGVCQESDGRERRDRDAVCDLEQLRSKRFGKRFRSRLPICGRSSPSQEKIAFECPGRPCRFVFTKTTPASLFYAKFTKCSKIIRQINENQKVAEQCLLF